MGGCLSIYFSTVIIIGWENISQDLSCPSQFLSQILLKLTSSLPQQQGENSRERGRLSTSIFFLHLCPKGQDGSGGDASGGFVSTREPAALLLLLMSVLTSPVETSALWERTAETSVSACWEQGRIVPSAVSAAGDKERAESCCEHPYSRGGKDVLMVRGRQAAERLHSHSQPGCNLKMFAPSKVLPRNISSLSHARTHVHTFLSTFPTLAIPARCQ